jgi:arylsulfatase A-like enzyme
LKSVHITDLAPTLLYLLGCPVPSHLDGRVLVEAVNEPFREAHPRRWQDAEEVPGPGAWQKEYTSEESRAIEERLRELGYIE